MPTVWRWANAARVGVFAMRRWIWLRREVGSAVCFVVKAVDELFDVLVNDRVVSDVVHPLLELRGLGQLAEEQQVRGLEERAALRQLLDRIAAVAEDAAVAVDEAD